MIFVSGQDAGIITEANIQGAPTLLIEVLSDPRLDRRLKRDLYVHHGVPEYLVVDPDADRVEVHLLTSQGYSAPRILEPGEILITANIPRFSLDLSELLRRPEN